MDARLVVEPLVIAALVVLQVAVWQYRMALAARRHKSGATFLAAIDAVLWVTVLGQVLTHLDRPGNVVGYALGVAAGVYVGCLADERTTQNALEYRLVLPGSGDRVVADLRARGWPATAQPATGLTGPATVVFVTVDGNLAPGLERDLTELAPSTFWTSARLRSAASVTLPSGYVGLRPRPGIVGLIRWRDTGSKTGRPRALRGAGTAAGQ